MREVSQVINGKRVIVKKPELLAPAGNLEKLKVAIREAIELFNPKGIAIFSTCPVGLIGDDVHRVARQMVEEYPDVNIFGFSCEGYRGVSQSAGHHIANNGAPLARTETTSNDLHHRIHAYPFTRPRRLRAGRR